MYEIRGQDAPSPAQWETVAEIEADLANALIQTNGAGIPDEEREHYHSLVERMEEIRAQDAPSLAEWETVAEIEEELAGMFERHTLARYRQYQDRRTATTLAALRRLQEMMQPCPDCGGSGYFSDGRGGGEECGCMGWNLDLADHPVATDDGRLEPLSVEEVDALCEALNTGKHLRDLDDRELAMTLAALRELQDAKLSRVGFDLAENDVATDGGRLEPLSVEEIDALCEELNVAGSSVTVEVWRGRVSSIAEIPDGWSSQIVNLDLDEGGRKEQREAFYAGELEPPDDHTTIIVVEGGRVVDVLNAPPGGYEVVERDTLEIYNSSDEEPGNDFDFWSTNPPVFRFVVEGGVAEAQFRQGHGENIEPARMTGDTNAEALEKLKEHLREHYMPQGDVLIRADELNKVESVTISQVRSVEARIHLDCDDVGDIAQASDDELRSAAFDKIIGPLTDAGAVPVSTDFEEIERYGDQAVVTQVRSISVTTMLTSDDHPEVFQGNVSEEALQSAAFDDMVPHLVDANIEPLTLDFQEFDVDLKPHTH
jgi:hypothetical protein